MEKLKLHDKHLLEHGVVGSKERLERLIDRYLELQQSKENKRRGSLYLSENCARDQWHGTPLPGSFHNKGMIPFTVDLQYGIWQCLWPFYDFKTVFTNSRVYLDFQLARRIAQFQWLPDDTYLDNRIFIYLGTPFEPSLFGMDVVYSMDRNPAIIHNPVINSYKELQAMEYPDFYKSGLMPIAHRMWEEMTDILHERIDIQFIEWIRSPFGVATDVRGFEQLLIDMMTDKDFFYALLNFVVNSQRSWYEEWFKFIGKKPEGISIFNDEVDGKVISSDHYLEYIVPHEVELNRSFSLISYYHSCGNLTPMVKHISRIPNIRMLDLGPNTDKRESLTALKKDYLLEIRFHPEKDVLKATPDQMQSKIKEHVVTCREFDVGAVTFRASGMLPGINNAVFVINKIRDWVNSMRMITRQEAEIGGYNNYFKTS